jgi:hypothetical protein
VLGVLPATPVPVAFAAKGSPMGWFEQSSLVSSLTQKQEPL